MKLVTFELNTPAGRVRRLGALIDGDETGRVCDLTAAYAAFLAHETDEPTPHGLAELRTPPDLIGWLEGAHRSREAAELAVAYARSHANDDGLHGERLVHARSDVRLLAPLPRPNSLRDFSIYQEHMSKADVPFEKTEHWYKTPPYYKGNCDTITGPEDPVPYPYYTERLDLELEIGIIVGKQGSNLTFEEARDCIAGYTILVDGSCRDGYGREPFGPTKRKDFNTALGPCMVTADGIDERNLDCRIAVDGDTWWEGSTGEARSFYAEHLVAYASDNEVIYPGDLIGTGTVGHGCSMDIHKWIQVGQTATFTVGGIGSMSLTVVEGPRVVDHVHGMKGLLEFPGN